MRQVRLACESVLQTDRGHGGAEQRVALGRAVAGSSEMFSNLTICAPLFRHSENRGLHLLKAGEAGEAAHSDPNVGAGCVTTAPYEARLDPVPRAPQDDLVHQAAEQGLLLRPGEHVLVPQIRKLRTKVLEHFQQVGGNGPAVELACLRGESFLGLFQFPERLFPAPFQFRCNESILWFGMAILTFGQMSLVSQPFNLLPLGFEKFIPACIRFLEAAGRDVDFGHRQRLKEPLQDLTVYLVCQHMLADGLSRLGMQQ